MVKKSYKNIFDYMEEELGIDPEGVDIGWYPDYETREYYIVRFVLEGVEYQLGFNKELGIVESMI